MHLAGLPWGAIVAERAANIHPPLYFLVLKGWSAVAGQTPFAARYLSALAAVLLPAVVQRFTGRRFGARSGRAAAVMVAMGTPFAVYGQEVRAYAWLPVLLVTLWSQVWPDPGRAAPGHGARVVGTGSGLVLGLTVAAMALAHYAGLIAAGTAAVGLLWRWIEDPSPAQRRIIVRQGLIGAGVAVVAVVPWAFALGRAGLSGLGGQAGLGNSLADPVPAGYVAGLLGVFHTVGLPEALGNPMLVRPSVLIGVLVLVGTIRGLAYRKTRRGLGLLVVLWLTPFVAAPVIWILSPQSHPRYLYPFIVSGWMVAGVLVGRGVLPKPLHLGLLAAMSATSLLGLRSYLFDPAYARTDIRGAAAYIRERALPSDLVLVPDTDWSLSEYDVGSAKIVMATNADGRTPIPAPLAAETSPGTTVFALDYERGALDPREVLRSALVSSGVLVERVRLHGITLERYTLRSRVEPQEAQTPLRACVSGTELCLVGVALDAEPVSGAAMGVRLDWVGRADRRLTAALRLYSSAGVIVAARDALLLDGEVRPTELWSGEPTTTYHVVPLPVGLPPEPYRLELGVFESGAPEAVVAFERDGDVSGPAVVLGQVTPLVSPWLDVSLYGLSSGPQSPRVQTAGPDLIGGAVDRDFAAAGQTCYVLLNWRVSTRTDEQAQVTVVLRQWGRDVAKQGSRSSFAGLPEGRPVLEYVPLVVPPGVSEGPADVIVAVNGEEHGLGMLQLTGGTHEFAPPSTAYAAARRAGEVATLVGFGLTPGEEIGAGEPMTVSLVWRAEAVAAERGLKVFVHLIDDTGAIVAQHDGVPNLWTRPTQGWVRGEYIVDPHPLTWHSRDTRGPATLRVGLYGEASGERVVWDDGADFVTLSVDIVVSAPSASP